ncbi:NAD-dependent epimerase/dehydratase family protein [Kitasatospora sp. SC0581]|uniref:NAD-dependent epimerase/dehydratase family protein n=1 Tax=Kitasatospora sp. SC0581 TaxID=3394360 RepID=UPI003A89A046
MRILVLGGGWFLGPAVVAGAVTRGWDVTTFTRGRSGIALPGATAVHGDRERPDDLARLADEYGPWDAVIDTSASALSSRDVLAGARALELVANRYVYVSTVAVYEGWPTEPLSTDSAVWEALVRVDQELEQPLGATSGINPVYGRRKAGTERAVTDTFGLARTSLLRPGVLLGPGEYVGRLPWWLHRAERGGRILAPGDPSRSIQPVDVRDVAVFALDQALRVGHQVHNLAAPIGRETMGGLLQACVDTTGSSGTLVWVQDDVLLRHGLRQWTELPLWWTHPGTSAIDATSAVEAGFVSRPLTETVADTWAWLRSGNKPVPHRRWEKHGLDPDKERAVLASAG